MSDNWSGAVKWGIIGLVAYGIISKAEGIFNWSQTLPSPTVSGATTYTTPSGFTQGSTTLKDILRGLGMRFDYGTEVTQSESVQSYYQDLAGLGANIRAATDQISSLQAKIAYQTRQDAEWQKYITNPSLIVQDFQADAVLQSTMLQEFINNLSIGEAGIRSWTAQLAQLGVQA